MPVIKHIFFYSLFLAGNLCGSDCVEAFSIVQDNEQFNGIEEQEVYPLEDFETIFIVPDVQDDQELETELMTSDVQASEESQTLESFSHLDEQVAVVRVDAPGLQEAEDFLALEDEDEDDIVPVPHELINSVKKANKKKKKLEKKERKSFLKKLKRNHA